MKVQQSTTTIFRRWKKTFRFWWTLKKELKKIMWEMRKLFMPMLIAPTIPTSATLIHILDSSSFDVMGKSLYPLALSLILIGLAMTIHPWSFYLIFYGTWFRDIWAAFKALSLDYDLHWFPKITYILIFLSFYIFILGLSRLHSYIFGFVSS